MSDEAKACWNAFFTGLVLGMFVIGLAGVFVLVAIGGGVADLRKQAIEHGYAAHDAKTGQWRWNADAASK